MARGRAAASLVALALAVLVAGVAVGAGTMVGAPAGAGPDPAIGSLAWEPCTDERDHGLDCARPLVPLDHDDPFGPQIQLYVVRLPATGATEDRIGSLFVNPGGPGGSALGLLPTLASGLSPEVRARYDVVAFSPRGVVGSRPVLTCEEQPGPDELPHGDQLTTEAEWLAYLEVVDELAAQDATACQLATARTGRYLSTNQVADDLDLLRAAVGDDRLSYWGISYGSRIGTVYAQRHPDRVGAMVLDGVVDPTIDWYGMLRERGASYDAALAVYLGALPHLEAVVDGVVEVLEAEGSIPVRIDGEPQDLTARTLLRWLRDAAPRQARWSWFEAQALAVQAQLAGGPVAELSRIPPAAFTDFMYQQIGCIDTRAEVSLERAARDAARMVAEGPIYGWAMADGLTQCRRFPVPDDLIPGAPPAALPPVLLVSSLHDPATPHVWAERAEAFLPGSRLLTYEGAQHGTWSRASACIDAHVDAYLVHGVLPPPGARCPLAPPGEAAPTAPPPAEA